MVHHPEGLQGEEVALQAKRPAHEQLEARFGRLVLVAAVFQFFQFGDDGGHGRIVRVDLQAVLLGLHEHVGPSRLVGDEHPAHVAHLFRGDVLIGDRVALHRAHMHAALVGKGRVAHVGLVAVVRQVGQFIHQSGGAVELVDALSDLALESHLEDERRDDGGQVGVAAPFAVAVDRALHVGGAELHAHQGVGHRSLGIVVRVDADARRAAGLVQELADPRHDLRDLVRQGAAVGVAEHERFRAAGHGPGQGGQAVLAVVFEPVEKVLGIVDEVLDPRPQVGERVLDDQQVVLQLDAQGVDHVDVPALAEDGHCRGARRKQGLDVGVPFRRLLEVAGRAEGGQAGALEFHLLHALEEVHGQRVGAGPAALDEVNAQPVELAADLDLVLDRKVEILGLGAIPQGGVVQFDGACHSLQASSSGRLSLSRAKASCRQRTASSVYFSAMMHETLISEVETIIMLMPSLARIWNMVEAMPG